MHITGSPIDYFVAFIGGVMVSFTPCIYPLIPITAGYIGAGSSTSRKKGMFLSFVYVTGIAFTYSLLGLLVSFTGTIFGAISTHPVTNIIVGAIIILFGISMLGFFTVSAPNIIKLPNLKKQNYFSTFVLGLVSGLIVSPCLTPVLGSILFYLTTKKNLFYGAALLFSFAYGMGLVLILAGTFSSFLVNLPKAGKWAEYIKRMFAFLLIGMGIYLIFAAVRRL